ncbi:FMN-dependent dehydrogenase [Steroidobacter agaridevorans]|nr:FMN-dependent dehydrogenase [Steroidobacter agaridevorans]
MFDFIDGGAEGEFTLARNCLDFDSVELLPRVLKDVSHCDLSVSILGCAARLPIAVAPTGLAALVWRHADIALARAAHETGIPLTVSAASSVRLEHIRAAVPESRLWMQVYLWKDRELIRSLVRRALSLDFEALVYTADVPILGQRHRDLRNRFTVPLQPNLKLAWDACVCPRWSYHMLRQGIPKMINLIDGTATDTRTASLASVMMRNLNASNTWADLAWLRDLWPRKLLVKGIMSPLDANEAVSRGVDAIIVSNHGGRQLDFAASPLSVLASVVDTVKARCEVILDGGVRRGSDIAKALALGAGAVMIGRATLFGVASGGEAGARCALSILESELQRTLVLMGCSAASELDRAYLRTASHLNSPS